MSFKVDAACSSQYATVPKQKSSIADGWNLLYQSFNVSYIIKYFFNVCFLSITIFNI